MTSLIFIFIVLCLSQVQLQITGPETADSSVSVSNIETLVTSVGAEPSSSERVSVTVTSSDSLDRTLPDPESKHNESFSGEGDPESTLPISSVSHSVTNEFTEAPAMTSYGDTDVHLPVVNGTVITAQTTYSISVVSSVSDTTSTANPQTSELVTDEMVSANEILYTTATEEITELIEISADPENGTRSQTEYNPLNYTESTPTTETPFTDHIAQAFDAELDYSNITVGNEIHTEAGTNYTVASDWTEITEEVWDMTTSSTGIRDEEWTYNITAPTYSENDADMAEVWTTSLEMENSTLSSTETYTNDTLLYKVTLTISTINNTIAQTHSATFAEDGAVNTTVALNVGEEWAWSYNNATSTSVTSASVTEDLTEMTSADLKDAVFLKTKPMSTKQAEPEPTTETLTTKPTYYKPIKEDSNFGKLVPKVIELTTIIPSSSTWSPPLYITLIMKVSVEEFHTKIKVLRADIYKLMIQELDDVVISEKQVVVLSQGVSRHKNKVEQKIVRPRRSRENSEVQVYMEDDKGYYSYALTKQLMALLAARGIQAFKGTTWQELIIDMKFHGSKGLENMSVEDGKKSWQPHVGILVAIVIGVIAATIVLAFVILQLVILKRRRRVKKMRHSYDTRYSMDTLQALNMDSIQLTSIRMTDNRWGAYVNPALVIDDKDAGSNPLNFAALSNFIKDDRAMEGEFMMLPNYVARMTDIPPGAEDKNRYANVIPVPETRVTLMTVSEKNPVAAYINANFVRGYLCAPHSYIATQAPLKNTVEDFWRMVFEQKSQAILMITALEENGSPRCVEYWPNTDGGDTSRRFGEFQVTLLKRDIRHEWITSTLRLRRITNSSNQYLDVYHFWLTSWPHAGLPDSKTLLGYLIDARPYMEQSIGPTVVHCSPGTGRTGVVLAVDIQMLSYDDSKLVDILSCVCGLRQDRAGLVQTKEQYKLIYKAVFEYAQALNSISRNPSRTSSYNSIQIVH